MIYLFIYLFIYLLIYLFIYLFIHSIVLLILYLYLTNTLTNLQLMKKKRSARHKIKIMKLIKAGQCKCYKNFLRNMFDFCSLFAVKRFSQKICKLHRLLQS